MNFQRVPERTVEEIRLIVETQIKNATASPIIEGIRAFLTTPRLEMRTWDWAKPLTNYPVWIVAESRQYD
jgi:hypothetical protein